MASAVWFDANGFQVVRWNLLAKQTKHYHQLPSRVLHLSLHSNCNHLLVGVTLLPKCRKMREQENVHICSVFHSIIPSFTGYTIPAWFITLVWWEEGWGMGARSQSRKSNLGGGLKIRDEISLLQNTIFFYLVSKLILFLKIY